MNLSIEKIKKVGIALAVAYAVFKYGKGEAMKAAALGVAGVVVAKQIPYVQDALN